MTNFTQILNKFRKESFSEREKGYKFEKLIKGGFYQFHFLFLA